MENDDKKPLLKRVVNLTAATAVAACSLLPLPAGAAKIPDNPVAVKPISLVDEAKKEIVSQKEEIEQAIGQKIYFIDGREVKKRSAALAHGKGESGKHDVDEILKILSERENDDSAVKGILEDSGVSAEKGESAILAASIGRHLRQDIGYEPVCDPSFDQVNSGVISTKDRDGNNIKVFVAFGENNKDGNTVWRERLSCPEGTGVDFSKTDSNFVKQPYDEAAAFTAFHEKAHLYNTEVEEPAFFMKVPKTDNKGEAWKLRENRQENMSDSYAAIKMAQKGNYTAATKQAQARLFDSTYLSTSQELPMSYQGHNTHETLFATISLLDDIKNGKMDNVKSKLDGLQETYDNTESRSEVKHPFNGQAIFAKLETGGLNALTDKDSLSLASALATKHSPSLSDMNDFDNATLGKVPQGKAATKAWSDTYDLLKQGDAVVDKDNNTAFKPAILAHESIKKEAQEAAVADKDNNTAFEPAKKAAEPLGVAAEPLKVASFDEPQRPAGRSTVTAPTPKLTPQ
ncbi:MAG: hypothetical protein FWF24_02225 [Alphaproteobacteria bacterium]|nr:hypothetical protein [Alphaproteobacteria bacterium]